MRCPFLFILESRCKEKVITHSNCEISTTKVVQKDTAVPLRDQVYKSLGAAIKSAHLCTHNLIIADKTLCSNDLRPTFFAKKSLSNEVIGKGRKVTE